MIRRQMNCKITLIQYASLHNTIPISRFELGTVWELKFTLTKTSLPLVLFFTITLLTGNSIHKIYILVTDLYFSWICLSNNVYEIFIKLILHILKRKFQKKQRIRTLVTFNTCILYITQTTESRRRVCTGSMQARIRFTRYHWNQTMNTNIQQSI